MAKCKGKKKKSWLPLLLLPLLLAACATTPKGQTPTDPFAYNAYGTISTAIATVDIIDAVFTDLRAKKEVSDTAWAKYDSLANKTIDKISYASKMMADYKRGLTGQTIADVAVQALSASLKELEDYYKSQIPESKRKPLIN